MWKAENKRKSLYENLAKLGEFDDLATQAAYNKDEVYLTWRTSGKNTCKECAKRHEKHNLSVIGMNSRPCIPTAGASWRLRRWFWLPVVRRCYRGIPHRVKGSSQET